jgi:hypothetical protein
MAVPLGYAAQNPATRSFRHRRNGLDQPCPFRLRLEKEVAARAGGGSFRAAEGCGATGGCKLALGGKIAGIRLERRDDFAKVRTLCRFGSFNA